MKIINIKPDDNDANKDIIWSSIMLSNGWIVQRALDGPKGFIYVYQIDLFSSEAIVPFGNATKKSFSDLKFQFQ